MCKWYKGLVWPVVDFCLSHNRSLVQYHPNPQQRKRPLSNPYVDHQQHKTVHGDWHCLLKTSWCKLTLYLLWGQSTDWDRSYCFETKGQKKNWPQHTQRYTHPWKVTVTLLSLWVQLYWISNLIFKLSLFFFCYKSALSEYISTTTQMSPVYCMQWFLSFSKTQRAFTWGLDWRQTCKGWREMKSLVWRYERAVWRWDLCRCLYDLAEPKRKVEMHIRLFVQLDQV